MILGRATSGIAFLITPVVLRGIACDENGSERAMMVANVTNRAYFKDTSMQPSKQTTVNINAQCLRLVLVSKSLT
jgi:hypothetical protein